MPPSRTSAKPRFGRRSPRRCRPAALRCGLRLMWTKGMVGHQERPPQSRSRYQAAKDRRWTSRPTSGGGPAVPPPEVDQPSHLRRWTSRPTSGGGPAVPPPEVDQPSHLRRWTSRPTSGGGPAVPPPEVDQPSHLRRWTSRPTSVVL